MRVHVKEERRHFKYLLNFSTSKNAIKGDAKKIKLLPDEQKICNQRRQLITLIPVPTYAIYMIDINLLSVSVSSGIISLLQYNYYLRLNQDKNLVIN